MDIEQARFNMVEQQIRPWEVVDQKVLDLITNTPREEFVSDQYQDLAFSDTNIPLGHNQVMMTPKLEARMLQALEIQSDEEILEIGTGSGYVTALLSQLGRHVTSEEIYADFTSKAAEQLKAINLSDNVTLNVTDSTKKREFYNRYDVIVVTGSTPQYDPIFQEQLSIGGRLFIIVGESPVMEALLIERLSEHEWKKQVLLETNLPALLGTNVPDKFVF
ncbi:MAG: protein-L-isoaspartate O-methyltransferase [Gammaproteobacteria bacterium]